MNDPSYMGIDNDVYYHMRNWEWQHPEITDRNTKAAEAARYRAELEQRAVQEKRDAVGWGQPVGIPF